MLVLYWSTEKIVLSQQNQYHSQLVKKQIKDMLEQKRPAWCTTCIEPKLGHIFSVQLTCMLSTCH